LIPAAIATGGIPDSVDVLIVPQVSATAVYEALGTDGREAITSWVAAGGHLVTWGGGEEHTDFAEHESTHTSVACQISGSDLQRHVCYSVGCAVGTLQVPSSRASSGSQ
jgi:hypothetical protein